MIKKERLEELIEQGDTIWSKDILPINLMNFQQKYSDCFYSYKTYIKNNQLICEVIGDYDFTNTYSFEDLFETRADAEEYAEECAEFGNITRTERLELPNWNEVPEYQDKTYYNLAIFRNRNNDYNCDFYIKYDTPNYSRIMITNGCVELFNKPLTRENYDDARRLCVKLFKGE